MLTVVFGMGFIDSSRRFCRIAADPNVVRAFAFDSGVTITFLSAAAGCSGADFRKEYYVEERLRLLGR